MMVFAVMVPVAVSVPTVVEPKSAELAVNDVVAVSVPMVVEPRSAALAVTEPVTSPIKDPVMPEEAKMEPCTSSVAEVEVAEAPIKTEFVVVVRRMPEPL